MTLKVNPIVATLIIAGILILLFALFKGCQQANRAIAANSKLISINDSLQSALRDYKSISDISTKQFQDSLEFERGQSGLMEAQKKRTEDELNKMVIQNKELLAKHKLAEYEDTSAVVVPNEFVTDCENCFTRLETTTNLTLKYKSDYNKLQDSWNKQTGLYNNRLKEIEKERVAFNTKITYLTNKQQEYIDKLKPRGRLYLSWGVIFAPWPIAAGAGGMYQNKRNLIYGVKWRYGNNGHMVETTINYPLSLRFK